MNYQEALDSVYKAVKKLPIKGEVASYIPELSRVNPDLFSVHLLSVDGDNYSVGEKSHRFSVQSIIKVLTLTLALEIEEDGVWKRVNVEPSGNPFNSLVQLEYEQGIPRNPFINAGALVICDILLSHLKNPKDEFLSFVRRISNSPTIDYNARIALSEKNTGFRNVALANFMKGFGNINNDINKVLDFYFCICSIEMSCEEVANAFIIFANRGSLLTGERIISVSKSKRINAIMQTCGFYDEAGEFTFKVGLPGKSGVGGGIIAIYPANYTIAVWSPRLNQKGNSYLGLKFLEQFTTITETSIF